MTRLLAPLLWLLAALSFATALSHALEGRAWWAVGVGLAACLLVVLAANAEPRP